MACKTEAFQICSFLWPGLLCEICLAAVMLRVPVVELPLLKEDRQQTAALTVSPLDFFGTLGVHLECPVLGRCLFWQGYRTYVLHSV